MSEYQRSLDLERLAEKVINKYAEFMHLTDPDCRILYQYCDEAKKSRDKILYADTERIKDKLKGVLPFDFVITFYKPNTDTLNQECLERLMYHELRHVGFEGAGKYSIIPHDIEDFRDVIDMWGFDWVRSNEKR